MGTSVLDREMFAEAEAARLLRVSQSTLHWWLDGGTYRGRTYRPVIRIEPRGERSVTWAEFVEAGLLREYRRTHKVALAQLRIVIDRLRERYHVPYPLAHYQPFVGPGRELLLEVQQEAGLDAEVCLVAVANDQLLLTPAVETFVQRVHWADGIAVGWRPHDDPASPVRMSPGIRFGRPAVGGISTVVLWEHIEGGDSVNEVAETFDLPPADVRWAYAYEAAAQVA
jgi:uncharacterized protein (DUF433 family)